MVAERRRDALRKFAEERRDADTTVDRWCSAALETHSTPSAWLEHRRAASRAGLQPRMRHLIAYQGRPLARNGHFRKTP